MANEAGSSPAPAKDASLAERLKAWADTTSTVVKTALSVLGVLVVAVVIGLAGWRDRTSHALVLTIAPDDSRALLHAGADVDLRQAVVDAINDRVRDVEQIALVRGFAHEVDADQAASISFKPFGLDASTDQTTSLIRYIVGAPPHLAVTLALVCEPADCAAPGARPVTLHATASGPGFHDDAFTALPPSGPALRRILRQAVRQTAERVLDRTEPLIASLYAMTQGTQDLFADDRERDLAHAEAAAIALRGDNPELNCFADAIPAFVSFGRGQADEALQALGRAARHSEPACRVRVGSFALIELAIYATCAPDAATRQREFDLARNVLAGLAALPLRGSEPLAARVRFDRILIELARVARGAGDPARTGFCTHVPVAAEGTNAALVPQIQALLDDLRTALPPNTLPSLEHLILVRCWELLDYGVPRDDVADRYQIARAILRAIDDDALTEQHPRVLFTLQGDLHMDIAGIARDALALSPEAKRQALRAVGAPAAAQSDPDGLLQATVLQNLADARASFSDALSNDTSSGLDEPLPDIDALALLGAASDAGGDEIAADDAYARAFDAFIADAEPVNELLSFTKAAAAWHSMLVAEGACADPSLAAAWQLRWRRLGGAPAALCGAAGAARGGPIYTMVEPFMTALIKACETPAASVNDGRLVVVDCLRRTTLASPALRAAMQHHPTSAAADARIQQALASLH